ncbi:DUF4406 domain-containing protein [Cellulomonas cellasea]|uniref:DUF4406 domain-containing protein n=1 Tax=Cellulomonas cellasea TaxID=43670 RepID=UPI0025A347D8|nr:DUF4406 domain-containing protein [Cellulomonas cellasea]MDM8086331.1 DUF4406 domain-containing protein [Cellulomonas cellasea]
MRVYISGPMTGYPGWNFPAFNAAEERLRTLGHDVLNPADGGADEAKTWADYLREDIGLVVTADAIAVLPGWQESRGACLEVHVAHQLGMTVLPIDRWEAAA